MTKLKLSAKMHIIVIVSAVIIAVGLAVGLICQFCADGYFNYGGDYKDYQTVEINYTSVEYKDKEITDLCEKQFKELKLSYYTRNFIEDTELGSTYEYRFSKRTDSEKLNKAAAAIDAALKSKDSVFLTNASYHAVDTMLGGSKALVFGSIALASAVVFQFIYFAVRYRLTAALSALLADIHNLALFVSLLAITRIPVGSSVITFSVLCVLITMIGCCFLFDRLRKNVRDGEFAKLDVFAQMDTCAAESLRPVVLTAACFAAVAVLVFVLLSISALSVSGVLMPVLCGLLCAVVCVYGTSFFTPAVHSRFKRIGDKFKAEHTKKPAKKQ